MKDKIQQDLKAALLAHDELKTSVLRMLLSAGNYKNIDLGRELTDEDWIGVINKEVKQRSESIAAYRESRPDLAVKEEKERVILQAYLPEQMGEDELEKIVREAVAETGASGIRDMGRVIALVKQRAGTGAQGGRIAAVVKNILGV